MPTEEDGKKAVEILETLINIAYVEGFLNELTRIHLENNVDELRISLDLQSLMQKHYVAMYIVLLFYILTKGEK